MVVAAQVVLVVFNMVHRDQVEAAQQAVLVENKARMVAVVLAEAVD